jgi:hypothetical protein
MRMVGYAQLGENEMRPMAKKGGWGLHQLMSLTDEEPTYRRKQAHESRLNDRLE